MYLIILSFIISYLIGSVNPAFLLGKLKGIDIREHGTKNPGTRNVKNTLGIWYAVITACYDVFKGIIAIQIGLAFQLDFYLGQICGIFAALGHMLPFYMNFSGGQGSATFAGIMLYYGYNYLSDDIAILYGMLITAVFWISYLLICRRTEIVAMVIFPIFNVSLYRFYPDNPLNISVTIYFIFYSIVYIIYLSKNKVIVIEHEHFKKSRWRIFIRPVALLYLVFYHLFSKDLIIFLMGIPALILITMDLVHLYKTKNNKKVEEFNEQDGGHVYRSTERGKFSSMTGFLVSLFISVLLFEKKIAMICITFLIVGDLFGKFFGLAYGKHKLFKKTWEGSIALFMSTIMSSYILLPYVMIPFWLLILAGFCTALIEVLPTSLNDNFTMPIITGSLLTGVLYFL